LFLFLDMMFDHLGQHLYLRVVVVVGRAGPFNVRNQILDAVVLQTHDISGSSKHLAIGAAQGQRSRNGFSQPSTVVLAGLSVGREDSEREQSAENVRRRSD
jgi:hypothetical protein